MPNLAAPPSLWFLILGANILNCVDMLPALTSDTIVKRASISDLDHLADSLTSVQAELTHWQDLIFSFDMDDDRNTSNGSQHDNLSSGARGHGHNHPQAGSSSSPNRPDIQDAALLAQFAASAAAQHHTTASPNVEQAYAAFIQALMASHGGYPPTQPSSNLPSNFFFPPPLPQINQLPNLQQSSNLWTQHQPPPESYHQSLNDQSMRSGNPPPAYPHFPYSGNQSMQNDMFSRSPASTSPVETPNSAIASTSASTMDQGEPDPGLPTSEDKRRRNTAASARFRIKKKQKTLNLERSVSDLTGRAEELEREAADLRRENGWLKEIVMLKGTRLAGVNLAGPSTNTSSTPASGSGPSQGQAVRRDEEEEEEPEDHSSDEDYKDQSNKKGKNKSRK